ncbi:MAG: MOSC domain-containing protein [Mycobacteriaceae bacterium]
MTTTVRSIHRFPVKSMLGETLTECSVDAGGLLGDRAYALLDVERGTIASAKDPRRWGALLDFSAAFVSEPVAGEAAPVVDLVFPDGSRHRSDDPDVDDALSAVLGCAVRLLREPPPEATFDEVWPDIDGLAPQGFIDGTRHHDDEGLVVSRIGLGMMAPAGTFFDLAVLHLLTTATLARLRELATEAGSAADFDPRRFRPNLLLDDDAGGGSGFVEDAWVGRELQVGSQPERARLSVSMVTMRCVMTTLAQQGLPRDADTLRVVARHHREKIPGLGTWACAGVYGGVSGPGVVRVGDEITLVAS